MTDLAWLDAAPGGTPVFVVAEGLAMDGALGRWPFYRNLIRHLRYAFPEETPAKPAR